MIATAFLSAALISGVAAVAPTQSTTRPTVAPAGSAEENAKPDRDERLICRRITEVTTRMGAKRVCMTREEWREHDRNNR